MFIHFDDIFNRNDERLAASTIPQILLDALNQEAPDGLEYRISEHGDCFLYPKDGNVTLSGFVLNDPEKYVEILGGEVNDCNISRYSYNSQKTIEFCLSEPGVLCINGQKVRIEALIVNPLKDYNLLENRFFMQPEKFPPPFPLRLSAGDITVDVLVSRVPNESLWIAKYQTVGKTCFSVTYYVDEKAKSLSITFATTLSNAKKSCEKLNAIALYNAMWDGNLEINGQKLFKEPPSTSDSRIFGKEEEIFWRKVVSIENILRMSFDPNSGVVDVNVVKTIEGLYQMLIRKRPVKQDEPVESITAVFENGDEKNLNDMKNQDIGLYFEGTYIEKIMGKEIELPCIFFISQAKASEIEKMKDGKTRVCFDSTEQKVYPTCYCYLKQVGAGEFATATPEVFQKLAVAPRVSELLDSELF